MYRVRGVGGERDGNAIFARRVPQRHPLDAIHLVPTK